MLFQDLRSSRTIIKVEKKAVDTKKGQNKIKKRKLQKSQKYRFIGMDQTPSKAEKSKKSHDF